MPLVYVCIKTRKLKLAILEGREEEVTIKNYRKNGTSFWSRVHLCPIRDTIGNVTLIVGVQSEVNDKQIGTILFMPSNI